MSRVLTDSLTHAYVECEKPNRPMSTIDVPPMTISFPNKSFLFYKSKAIGRFPISTAFLKLCVFMHLWATDYTVGRRMPFQHFYGLSSPVIMSNFELWVFHPVGGGGGGGGGGGWLSTPTCYA